MIMIVLLLDDHDLRHTTTQWLFFLAFTSMIYVLRCLRLYISRGGCQHQYNDMLTQPSSISQDMACLVFGNIAG